jgi:hypothetical protein
VNNPNVKFKMNLESAMTKTEVDFTTEILVRLFREEISGELGLYPFTPPVDTGLPYLILNGIINGEDVFKMINNGWAYRRIADPQRKVIYYGNMNTEFVSYGEEIKISDENKRRFLECKWEFKT